MAYHSEFDLFPASLCIEDCGSRRRDRRDEERNSLDVWKDIAPFFAREAGTA